MATQESLFVLPAAAQPEASMLLSTKGAVAANGSGGSPPFSVPIQDPSVDLAKKTVCIKVRLSTMGNTRKVSTSQIEADADKDLLRVSKHLVDSAELKAIGRFDGETRVGSTLLKAGIADAEDWGAAKGNPFQFLKDALDRWVTAHGKAQIEEQFRLNLTLSTDLESHYAMGREAPAQPSKLFLTVEPSSAGYVVLGPTLRILEAAHPRLPATFAQLFLGALNRWIRTYDFCCRQQKSYYVAVFVMWRRDRAQRQTLAPLGVSAT